MAPWIDFEKIKREADFATVLRHYGFVFPAGRTQLKLPCPFHEDRTPSLSVNLADKVFHCFGCAAKGGLLDFVQRMERQNGRTVGARPAVLKIAEICGITGYEVERPKGATARERRRDEGSGADTTEVPSAPATPVLEASGRPEAHAEAVAKLDDEEPREINPPLSFTLKLDPTHAYFSERGISPAAVEAFGLGYAARGMMKGRICIPIHNAFGELVAYAGRWAGPDETIPPDEGKYKLPPRFQKSRVLFNLHRVIDPVDLAVTHLVVVEGYFGAMRLHELSVPAVALMGRTLSPDQRTLFEATGTRYVTLLLDGDEPGRQAVSTIMSQLAQTPLRVRAVMLPDGQQPDTVSRENLVELLDLDGTWPRFPVP